MPAYGTGLYGVGLYGGSLSPNSPVDATFIKFQVVKVYDTNGNFIDTIKDAPFLSCKENINAAADAVRLVLPRPIDAYDGLYQPGSKNTIVHGNIVQWWIYGAGIDPGGLLKFQGIIDTITPNLDENGGESVEVVVTPYSQILGDHGVIDVITFGTAGNSATYVDTGVMFRSFFSGSYIDSTGTIQSTIDTITSKPFGDPYTLDPASVTYTGQKTQYPFKNQKLYQVMNNILLLGPANHFFRMNQDKTTYFNVIPTLPTHTLLLGKHITSISFPQDNVPRKNIVFIQGNGVTGKYTGSSVSTLGPRVYYKADNRITDAATAQLLADGIGALLDQTVIRAKVKIPDYRYDGLPGLGYDIELFKVGQTVLIKDMKAPTSSIVGAGSVWGSFTWGSDKWGSPSTPTTTIWGSFTWGGSIWSASIGSIFNTVVVIASIQYDFFSVTLELGLRAPTLNRKLFDLEANFADTTLAS